jgi:hypothetical protein
MALRTYFTSQEHKTTSSSNTYIQIVFPTDKIIQNIKTRPELIGKPVITDIPNLFLLAASILTEEDKSTIF